MRLVPLTNRKFEIAKDGWFQIAPLGEFSHPTGITQVIDREAIKAMVNRFEEESKDENFPGLLLDFDHFSNDAKAPSEAAGWITALANRDDGNDDNAANGLWAQIRFTDVGESAVKNGRYRLASPVWNRKECEDLGGKRFRPQRLDRCALTNDPVLKGMVPLSNRVATDDDVVAQLRAELAELKEEVENRGNSAGAHKGWETRRGALSAFHAKSAHASRGEAAIMHDAARAEGKKGNTKEAARLSAVAQSHEKMAANHDKLAATYKGKAAVSGAKAHINKQLDILRGKSKPAAKGGSRLNLDPKKIKAAQESHEAVKKHFATA